MDLIENWADNTDKIGRYLASQSEASDWRDLDTAQLLPPLPRPGNFYCAGANYWDHLKEMSELVKKMTGSYPSMEKAKEPWFFVKTTRGAVVGHDSEIALPPFARKVDWEAELGVVIGRTSKNLTLDNAYDAIAGYVIVNDLSARDLVKREGSPFIYDWVGQKCFDGAAPMGPALTPAQFVADPQDLDITLRVNGEIKQNSNTGQMVHSIAEQLVYLSAHMTLFPGDVIATGTPSGVGMASGTFLAPGDRVDIEIEGLGVLSNRFVASR